MGSGVAGVGRTVARDLVGREMYELMAELYPLCRSISGHGVRETLRRLQGHIPVAVREVPSGTKVLDWVVPREWNINDAYVLDPSGKKIVDFHRNNLHIVSYSVPLRRKVPLAELKQHLHALPEHPDWIPYRTSYYADNWGFCISHAQFSALEDGEYEVVIDSSLEDGSLTYGEYLISGETPDEVLISTHACHPSLCNDNLSGVVVCTFLAKYLGKVAPRYSYRFLFIPGTIGSITWLALNEQNIPRIRHGLVVACVGDSGGLTYKRSRQGRAEIDRAVVNVLRDSAADYRILDFTPYGYDERQYCSPGFDLPVGCLSRTPHGQFPQYHTSADDLSFVQPRYLADSFEKCLSVFALLEGNRTYMNTHPKGEPQLGRRGLYRSIGGGANDGARELALLWVLNLSDGHQSLLDISDRSGIPFVVIRSAADALLEHGLLQEIAG